MPLIRLVEDNEVPQEYGVDLIQVKMRLYAVSIDNPLDLYDLGGHSIPDTPDYNETEASAIQRNVTINGQNQMVEEYLTDDTVQSEVHTINLPTKFVTMANRIREAQARNRKFRYFTASIDQCLDACDQPAIMLGDSGRLGNIKWNSGLVGFDPSADGGSAVMRNVTLKTTGMSRTYQPVEYRGVAKVTGEAPLYAIHVANKYICDASSAFCPYQLSYWGGGAGGVAATSAKSSANKFSSLTTIDMTAVPAGSIITDIVRLGDTVYFSYATASKTVSTTGGIAKSVSGAAATIISGLTNTGLQCLAVVGNRIYAFGNGGTWFYSDDGSTWVAGTSFTANHIYTAAYNPKTLRLYVGGASGAFYEGRNGRFTAMTGHSIAAAEIDKIEVAGEDHIIVGLATGTIHENFKVSKGGTWRSESLGASAIHAIVSDKRSSRVILSVGTSIKERSINTKQTWVTKGTAPAVVRAGAGGSDEYQRGLDYVVMVTVAGDIIEVEGCAPCVTAAP